MGKIKSGETFYDFSSGFELYAKSNRKPARNFKQLNGMMMKIGFVVGDL